MGSEDNKDEVESYKFEDEIVCPYCHYKHEDSCDFWDTTDQFEVCCEGCGRLFDCCPDVEITYSTFKKNEEVRDEK